MVPLAISWLCENVYGVTIHEKVTSQSDRERASPASLYVILDRPEEKRFVRSQFDDPTPQRGVWAKRFFSVTGERGRKRRSRTALLSTVLRGLKLLGDRTCVMLK
jgi:hypothetical protein